MTKRVMSDEEMVARLIDRCILLVAIDDDMPTERKLELEPMLNELAQSLSLPEGERDNARVRGLFDLSLELGAESQDAQALLGAVRNFVPLLQD